MSPAVYNEIEPFAAQWMRNLIAHGYIPQGVVDERSISDLTPDDVAGPGQRHFFAGIGGWGYAMRLAGVPDDASIWTGSCPCQPFSSASRGRGGGFESSKHLWPSWARLIGECRPAIIVGEQIATGGGGEWLSRVASYLEDCRYVFASADLCASLCGLPRRERLYFVAYAHGNGKRARAVDEEVASLSTPCDLAVVERLDLYRMGPEGDGVSSRMDQRRGYGNAIVPQVAAMFVRAAMEAA